MFEALEKRTLTAEEQAVIDERVAHQRRMFEQFEKREKARKIAELREVCPDITEEEAEKALNLCNGNEEEAAAALVSDPYFKRRIQPRSALESSASRQARNGKNSRRSIQAVGPRPKLVDVSSLGDSVFVGTFRGKGFQGNGMKSKVSKTIAPEPQVDINDNASEGGTQEPKLNENVIKECQNDKESEMEPKSPGTACHDGDTNDIDQSTPNDKSRYLSNDSKEACTSPRLLSTPSSINREWTLVKETSEGDLKAVTDSELVKVNRALHGRTKRASPKRSRRKSDASMTSVSKMSKPPTDGPSAAAGRRIAGPNSVSELSNNALEGMIERIRDMDERSAVSWLAKMAPCVASAVLSTFGGENPVQAVILRELLDQYVTDTENHSANSLSEVTMDNNATANDGTPQSSPAKLSKTETGENQDGKNIPLKCMRRSPRLNPGTTDIDTNPCEEVQEEKPKDEAGSPGGMADSERTQSEMNSPSASENNNPTGRVLRLRPQRLKLPGTYNDDVRYSDSSSDETYGKRRRRTNNKRKSSASASPSGDARKQLRASTASASDEGRDFAGKSGDISGLKAISARGHTNRGRVRQKSHKSAELVQVGTLNPRKGWFNAGYIFPMGFISRTLFRSSVALDQLCIHECTVLGEEGQYWPAPTFQVVAFDRPDEPLIAKSCTGCWSAALRRINSEIEARRNAGEDLPPPPKTAIAGPEYFGLNQPNIIAEIEALDPEHACNEYWDGKKDRELAAAGLPKLSENKSRPKSATTSRPTSARPRPPRSSRGSSRRRRLSISEDDLDNEMEYTTNRWSTINRAERYRKRLAESGESASGHADLEDDNPLPDLIDPITLEPVISPAISPYGHVMGAATWKAVLAESNGKCPFTKKPLKWEQCRILTKHNIDAYRDTIIR